MTKQVPIFISTLLLLSVVYFFSTSQKKELSIQDSGIMGSKANVAFDLLRTADPATGKIPSGAIMRVYRELQSRGFYQIPASDLKTEEETGWQQIDDFFPSLAVTRITYDPNNTQIFYFCTGEGWYNADAVKGAGIFKSTDGGVSWAQLESTDTLIFDYCQDIVIHPATSDVYVATRTGGLQRSTDGGETWEKVLAFGLGSVKNSICDIELTSDGGVFASIGIFETDGIYFSPTGDAGTFVKQTTGLPTSGYFRVDMATAPSNPDVAYSIYCNSTDYKVKGIYKTIDKGTTWTELNMPGGDDQVAASQAWYDMSMAVDPNDENVVALGGLHIWRTRDGGTTWQQLTAGGLDSVLLRYVHVDQHEITFKTSDEVYFGNDGGIWKCDDFTSETPYIYNRNDGYNVTQFYSVALHPFDNVQQLMGGTQDNGTPYAYEAGIADFKFVSGADGAFTAFNKFDPEIFYTSTQLKRLYRFNNGGFEPPEAITNPNVEDHNVLFINPFDLDASNPEYLYQCSNKGLWRFSNASFSDTSGWEKAANINGVLSAIGTSPAAPGVVFIGRSSGVGDIFRLEDSYNSDATSVPFNADPNDLLPDAGFTSSIYCSSIVVDVNDANHVVVTYSNYNLESVWESHNALSAEPLWTSIEGDLPDMPVYWSAIHPQHPEVIYLATEMGVFYSNAVNGDLTVWIPCSTFPVVRTDMLRIRTNDLTIAAGTHGRGIWQSQLDSEGLANNITWIERGPNNVGGRTRTIMVDPNDITGKTIWAGSVAGGLWKTTNIDGVPIEYPVIENEAFTIYPNPVSQLIHLDFYTGTNQKVRIELLDIKGNMIEIILDNSVSGQQHITHHFASDIAKGIYFIRLQSGKEQIVRKVIVG